MILLINIRHAYNSECYNYCLFTACWHFQLKRDDIVKAKFYCLYAPAEDNQCIPISPKFSQWCYTVKRYLYIQIFCGKFTIFNGTSSVYVGPCFINPSMYG